MHTKKIFFLFLLILTTSVGAVDQAMQGLLEKPENKIPVSLHYDLQKGDQPAKYLISLTKIQEDLNLDHLNSIDKQKKYNLVYQQYLTIQYVQKTNHEKVKSFIFECTQKLPQIETFEDQLSNRDPKKVRENLKIFFAYCYDSLCRQFVKSEISLESMKKKEEIYRQLADTEKTVNQRLLENSLKLALSAAHIALLMHMPVLTFIPLGANIAIYLKKSMPFLEAFFEPKMDSELFENRYKTVIQTIKLKEQFNFASLASDLLQFISKQAIKTGMACCSGKVKKQAISIPEYNFPMFDPLAQLSVEMKDIQADFAIQEAHQGDEEDESIQEFLEKVNNQIQHYVLKYKTLSAEEKQKFQTFIKNIKNIECDEPEFQDLKYPDLYKEFQDYQSKIESSVYSIEELEDLIKSLNAMITQTQQTIEAKKGHHETERALDKGKLRQLQQLSTDMNHFYHKHKEFLGSNKQENANFLNHQDEDHTQMNQQKQEELKKESKKRQSQAAFTKILEKNNLVLQELNQK